MADFVSSDRHVSIQGSDCYPDDVYTLAELADSQSNSGSAPATSAVSGCFAGANLQFPTATLTPATQEEQERQDPH